MDACRVGSGVWLLGGSPGWPCTVNNFQMDGIVVRVVVIIRGCSHDSSWCPSGVMVAVYYCHHCQKLFWLEYSWYLSCDHYSMRFRVWVHWVCDVLFGCIGYYGSQWQMVANHCGHSEFQCHGDSFWQWWVMMVSIVVVAIANAHAVFQGWTVVIVSCIVVGAVLQYFWLCLCLGQEHPLGCEAGLVVVVVIHVSVCDSCFILFIVSFVLVLFSWFPDVW